MSRASPKGPCSQILNTLGPMYLHSEYFKAKIYTIWVHGPLGFCSESGQSNLVALLSPQGVRLGSRVSGVTWRGRGLSK